MTLVFSLAGGLVAQALGLPASLLVGGALAVSIVSIAGFVSVVPRGLRDVAFVIIGMTLGTNVASDTLELIGQWPVSLAALVIMLAFVVVTTGLLLSRIFGLDRGTAFLAAFPGHLSLMLGVIESGFGNARQIAIIQSIRVLLLTLLVPIVARFTAGDLLVAGSVQAVLSVPAFFGLGAACVLGGFVFSRLKVPAAYVLGSMAVATIGKLMGLYEGAMPWPLTAFSFVVMGALIGSRFAGVGHKELSRAALGGLVVTGMAMASVTAAAMLVTAVTPMPFGQIWLGFAPGALEAMGALGISLGYDTAFITAHHTMRLLVLGFAIPAVAALAKGRRDS